MKSPFLQLHCYCGGTEFEIRQNPRTEDYHVECAECARMAAVISSYAIAFTDKEEANDGAETK